MTFAEQMTLIGVIVNTLGFLAVLLGQHRNRIKDSATDATSTAAQFSALDKACSASVAALRNELLLKIDSQHNNFGNAIQAVGNRIHGVELEAAKTRADAAENSLKMITSLREEFRRDVREETQELRNDMQASFNRLEAVVDNLSHAMARGMLGIVSNPG